MSTRHVARAVVITWIATAAWDFACANALAVFAYKSTFVRFWQGVASVRFGARMLEAGGQGVATGLSLHLSVALTWSLLFVLALAASPALRRFVARPAGAVVSACVYGPILWLVRLSLLRTLRQPLSEL